MSRGMTCAALIIAMAAMAAMAGCFPRAVRRGEETRRFQSYLRDQSRRLALDPNIPLSADRCEELAIAASLDLRVRCLNLSLQDEKVRLSLVSGLPQASAVYSDSTRGNRALANVGGMTTELQDRRQQAAAVAGVLPVLDWGLTYYSYQIAVDRKRQEQLLLTRAEQLLRRDVRVAYARHAGARRQERLASVAYQAAEQVLRVARSLEKEKMTVRADTALIEAALAEAGLQLSLARQSVAQTHLVLAQLMSLPPGVSFNIDEALPTLPRPPAEQSVAWFEAQALAHRPELGVQDIERAASASAVLRDAAAFFPRLDLTGSFNWSAQSGLVNPAFFLGGFQVSHALLDGGATVFQYELSRKTETLEKERTLLVSLGVLYEVQLLALRVQQAHETLLAADVLERSRRAGLARIISLYKEGLEDEAGAARALADLTIQSTALDVAQTNYVTAWHELEAAVLPEGSAISRAASQPATQPAAQAAPASQPASEAATQPAARPATEGINS
jgi:outer membrane protein TolC